jgi:hypothetical protein
LTFNFKLFLRFAYRALFKSKGTHNRLTPKRIAIATAFYIIYPLLEFINWTSFSLDEVLFPKYRDQEIQHPLFITGNPRSGTTFLYRLLAKDAPRFTCMHTWEILFAPSILQRKFWLTADALDRFLGDPVKKALKTLQKNAFSNMVMHKLRLREPEEDEYTLIHSWSTVAWGVYFILLDEVMPYAFFDTALPPDEKENVMRFYKHCVQRHLYAHNHIQGHYLAKNPSFSPKLEALHTSFPDAKFIYMVRNPLNVVPSYINFLAYGWHMLGDPLEAYPHCDEVIKIIKHWYSYPLAWLDQATKESYTIVRFNDLVRAPEQTVTDIYQHFGFDLTPDYARILKEEAERARGYRSKHTYALEDMGLSQAQIITEFKEVFDRFDFAHNDDRKPLGLL